MLETKSGTDDSASFIFAAFHAFRRYSESDIFCKLSNHVHYNNIMTLVDRGVDPWEWDRGTCPPIFELREQISKVPQHLRSNSSYLMKL